MILYISESQNRIMLPRVGNCSSRMPKGLESQLNEGITSYFAWREFERNGYCKCIVSNVGNMEGIGKRTKY